ncbi:MAG: hypothetical protein IAE80_17715 [Anaerolinea sp.]|nr:hypothetical protein [Anaerolinea sp.]
MTTHSRSTDDTLLYLCLLAAENAALRAQCRTLEREVDDLTEQVNHQKQTADELDILRNAIVRNVSHELKTPLLQIKSAVSLMAEDSDNPKLADYAMEATARLEAVVKNITQLADSLEIRLEPCQIKDCVDQALRTLRRSWEHQTSVERVRVELDGELPLVLADRQGLGVVLQLLIDNALKFSKHAVRVTARQDANWLIISVQDYGIGIERDKIDRIFEPFYQVDSSSTRRFGGAGVGLAIVRLILERHDAEINVTSEIGKGSTFSFALRIVELT